MKEAGEKNPGTMAAILGLSPEACEAVCGEASALGVCVPVNFNSPEQIVIAGVRPAVERASALAQERGAKRVIPLNVAGAFHSPLMRDAADAMARRLSSTEFSKPSAPVAMNVSGQLVEDAVAVRTSLERQLDSAVQWVKTIQSMKAAGVTKFVECGAGRVLSGLVRRVDKQLSVFSTETDEAVQEAARALEQVRRESV